MQTVSVESVEHWPLQRLIPYARNARTHDDGQVSQIAGSIAEFGFVNPILVGDDNVIIAGHGRLMAAQQLGLETVPVIVLRHLTEAQRRALVIADNKIAENAGWNEELLKLELGDLQDLGFDLDVIGFSDEELDELLGLEDESGHTDDDAVPEVEEEPVSKTGDLWLLGEHRLLCGDATRREELETLMAGDLADMAFTDPPYNVDYGNSAKDKLRGKDRRILNDNLGADFHAFLEAALGNLLAVTKGACYVAMSSSELDTLQRAFREAGGKWSTFIIWAKNTFTLGRSDYQRQYEPILYGWREGADHYWCGARDQGDVWFFNKPVKNDLHPTMKPVELVERAIRNSSKSRDIVLDLFGGSGSTLIACEKTGRRARVMELDPKYVDVIIRRWQEYTGEQARRAEDGATFDELAIEEPSMDDAI
ncbi:DNA methylase N-4 [Marinobacter lutaoensis]|uniref:Methyltransferase n=1 Tax=Marinobacter lutaoensis TaxID=135739 RepID=A0A1V2DRE8_9GAMM|nr:site-specific DNA-methyltransferase [Marinobacter lutaoensis]ONF43295.1 DNA methylase N-4 [Marinobacter lutaoensis]